MQRAETSTLDAQKETEKPKIAKLLDIAVDENNMVYVNWPIDKKELCLTALCEALKLVATYQKPIIETPKPKFTDFIRGIKNEIINCVFWGIYFVKLSMLTCITF